MGCFQTWVFVDSLAFHCLALAKTFVGLKTGHAAARNRLSSIFPVASWGRVDFKTVQLPSYRELAPQLCTFSEKAVNKQASSPYQGNVSQSRGMHKHRNKGSTLRSAEQCIASLHDLHASDEVVLQVRCPGTLGFGWRHDRWALELCLTRWLLKVVRSGQLESCHALPGLSLISSP